MNKIKYGVCGVGRIGVQHCRFFSADREHYELVALCDLDSVRVEAMQKEFCGKAYSDLAAFLADPDLELVIIATRSLDHAQHAAQALAAEKRVLLEKPIGVTAGDFKILQELAKHYPDKLFFGHNHRFEPAFMNTQAILAQGLLGHVFSVKLCKYHAFMRRNDWQMRLDCGGGQLSVWGPHLLDQSLQLLGAPVRDVQSALRSILTPGDADDHVQISLVGENGVVAAIEITNAVALPGPYCTICGDRGTLVYGQDQKTIHLKYLDPKFQWPDAVAQAVTPDFSQGMSVDGELPWIEETRQVEPEGSLWDRVEIEMVERLYQAIRNHVPFPVKSAEALEVVRITELVKKQNPEFKWIG